MCAPALVARRQRRKPQRRHRMHRAREASSGGAATLREHGITPHNLPGRLARAEHHEALPIDAVPDFMVWLHNEGMGARALEFAILTASRSPGSLLRHAGRAGHGSVTQTKRHPANPARFTSESLPDGSGGRCESFREGKGMARRRP